MRTVFHPFLPNGPTGDPAVWIDLFDEGRAVLFDLGDLRGLSNRRLLRVDRVVVTHTHMDHFIGFDQLLRVALGRERELAVSGPSGFLGHVRGRISGYTWNLIGQYPVRLVAEEIDGDVVRAEAYTGEGGMRPEPLADRPFLGTVHAHRAFTVHADTFDHGIPVLGVALRESEHLSVNKDRLLRAGLVPGPWLHELKMAVRRCEPGDRLLDVPEQRGGARKLTVERLAADLLFQRPGQKLAYLTDLAGTDENLERAAVLARDVDLLICEAAFLDADRELAHDRLHLTARQCGELARAARARRLAPFHLSPRYQGREEELFAEAGEAFGGPVLRLPRGPTQPESTCS
jgi:ribonuclease Z